MDKEELVKLIIEKRVKIKKLYAEIKEESAKYMFENCQLKVGDKIKLEDETVGKIVYLNVDDNGNIIGYMQLIDSFGDNYHYIQRISEKELKTAKLF